MSADPLVSVVIPAYGAGDYLRRALDSVFAQTYPNYEVIVVNDGSPDTGQFETAIEGYADRIVYLKQPNRGPGAARNTGIRQARGEFIAFLDSDDVWLPGYLERQLQGLRQEPGYDFIYADAMLWLEDKPSGQTFMQASPSRGPVTFDSLLSLDCIVISSCTVARRDSLVKAGLFDESFLYCEDFDLWLRVAYCGARMTYQKEVLACHRLRAGSLSTSAQRMCEGRRRVYEKMAASFPLTEAQRAVAAEMQRRWSAQMELEKGKQSLLAGDSVEARARLRLANTYFRSGKIRAALVLLTLAPAPACALYRARQRSLFLRLENAGADLTDSTRS